MPSGLAHNTAGIAHLEMLPAVWSRKNLTIFIVQKGGGFFQTADWVFWIVLASLVLIRYLDIRFLDGCTGVGEPATITHWIRYAAWLVACSTAVWVLAHGAGYLFATRAAQG